MTRVGGPSCPPAVHRWVPGRERAHVGQDTIAAGLARLLHAAYVGCVRPCFPPPPRGRGGATQRAGSKGGEKKSCGFASMPPARIGTTVNSGECHPPSPRLRTAADLSASETACSNLGWGTQADTGSSHPPPSVPGLLGALASQLSRGRRHPGEALSRLTHPPGRGAAFAFCPFRLPVRVPCTLCTLGHMRRTKWHPDATAFWSSWGRKLSAKGGRVDLLA